MNGCLSSTKPDLSHIYRAPHLKHRKHARAGTLLPSSDYQMLVCHNDPIEQGCSSSYVRDPPGQSPREETQEHHRTSVSRAPAGVRWCWVGFQVPSNLRALELPDSLLPFFPTLSPHS